MQIDNQMSFTTVTITLFYFISSPIFGGPTLSQRLLDDQGKSTSKNLSHSYGIKVDSIARIIYNNGEEISGHILDQNPREILFLTIDQRQILIPQYVIKEIEWINPSQINNKGVIVSADPFATRYFLTTNGLPIKKGAHYMQWNLFGPNLQFEAGENFGIGVMTTWLGVPLIVTAKKSFRISEKVHGALGALVGSGTYLNPDFAFALPFGTISIGDRKSNMAISGGYGTVWSNGETKGSMIYSIAGMSKVSPKISLIFDSFISTNFSLIMPGIRWHQSNEKAMQFGFASLSNYGNTIPIPMIQWYRRL